MVSIHLPVGTLRCETIAPLRGVRSSVSLPQSEIQMIPNHNQKNTTSPRSSSPSCLLPSPQKAPQRNVSWREKNPLELKVLGSSLESQRAPDKGSGGNPGIRQGKKLGITSNWSWLGDFCWSKKTHFGRKALYKKKYHQFLKLQPLTIDLICLLKLLFSVATLAS